MSAGATTDGQTHSGSQPRFQALTGLFFGVYASLVAALIFLMPPPAFPPYALGPLAFLVGIFFVLGACLESFAACLFYRRRRSISMIPPSQCFCGRKLHWWENVPVFGFAFSYAKKCCTKRVPFYMPLLETLAGVVGAMVGFTVLTAPTTIPTYLACAISTVSILALTAYYVREEDSEGFSRR